MIQLQSIKDIYKKKIPYKYDLMQKHMAGLKEKAVNGSVIKERDTVLVFCCGTGMEFSPLEERLGEGGKIIGVDFSEKMLEMAEKKIDQNNWQNIDLIYADVTQFDYSLHMKTKADAGICNLGFSIIPKYKDAFYNLTSSVRDGGEVIIGDMQLAQGPMAMFNPISIFLSRSFGGTFEGHKNTTNLYNLMKQELENTRKEEYMFKSYFIAYGKKASLFLNQTHFDKL